MAVSMAKLSSSSCCRPLLQGMMLLALLLLASIQAGPVMAQEQRLVGWFEKAGGWVEKAGGAGGTFPRTSPRSKDGVNHVGEEAFVETQGPVDEESVLVDFGHGKQGAVSKKVLSTGLCKKPEWKGFCNGAKMGIKVHKYLCKAQGWMDKQIPGGASGTQSYDVRFLAIDMSVSFPAFFRFSYGGNSVVSCRDAEAQVFWSPAAGTPVPSSSYPYP